MRNKYFYPIFKLKAKSWIRYWLLKKTEFKGKLSEILEGFSFNLQNTLRQKFVKFEILGNSIQDGEPSPENEVPIKSAGDNVNLLPFENINITLAGLTIYSSNGNLYLNGTNSSPIYSSQKLIEFLLPAGTYTSSENVSGRPTSFLRKSSDNSLINDTNRTFTLNEPTNVYLCGYIAPNNYTNYQLNWKLEQGTKATPYSPFGMGSITEKIVNKNLFDGEIELGGINPADGSLVSNNTRTRSKNFIKVKPNTAYTIQRTVGQNRWAIGYTSNKVGITDGNADNYASALKRLAENTLINTFTTSPTTEYIKWYDTYSTDLTEKVQIEQSSTATPYVPHEEQTYTIPVQVPFRSIGDVRDVFFKNTVDSPYYDENLVENGWYERHNINRYKFTGNEALLNEQKFTNVIRFFVRVDGMVSGNALSNNYRFLLNYTSDTEHFYTGTNQVLIFHNISIGTGNNFKSLLAEKYANGKPVYIDYIPITPTNLLCTTEQTNILENIPSTFSGQTNVFSIDEVEAYLKIQYWESDTNG
jgi:hypothetical protein